jgi:hypothetical protein
METVTTMSTTYESTHNAGDEDKAPPAAEHLQNLQDDAKAALDSVREQGTAQFEQYRETAAEQLASLAAGAKSAAENMQDHDTLGLSHYVTDVAASMSTLAEDLRGKSAEELLHKAGELAKNNPALFIAGSIALGFGLSRFLRASSPDINGGASSTGPSSRAPSDDAGNPYPEPASDSFEFDPHVASEEELVTTPPHTDDVYHSAQPGTYRAPGAPDRGQPYSPTDASSTRQGEL